MAQQPPSGVHKATTKRELDPKGTRAERKYEKLTGRNPRLGIVRSPSPRKGK